MAESSSFCRGKSQQWLVCVYFSHYETVNLALLIVVVTFVLEAGNESTSMGSL